MAKKSFVESSEEVTLDDICSDRKCTRTLGAIVCTIVAISCESVETQNSSKTGIDEKYHMVREAIQLLKYANLHSHLANTFNE